MHSSSEDEGPAKARAHRRNGAASPDGYTNALSAALEITGSAATGSKAGSRPSSSRSKSSSKPSSGSRRSKGSSSSSAEDYGDAPFTWHEFLATVAAIDHPDIVRQQRQQQLQQQQSAAEGLVGMLSLGPIAEGVEPAPSPSLGLHSRTAPGYTLALEDTGTATFPNGVAGAAAAAVLAGRASPPASARRTPTPPLDPRPAAAAAPRSIRGQQPLSLDLLDSELQSLGLGAAEAEPKTPYLLVHGPSSGGAAGQWQTDEAAADSTEPNPISARRWPGLQDEQRPASPRTVNGVSSGAPTQLSPRTAAGGGSPAGVRAQPSIIITPMEGAEQQGSGSGGGAVQHRQRRVTLFTESMRQRGESPEPGTKSIYNHQLHTSGRRAGRLVQQDAADELLDLLGDAPAGAAAVRSAGGPQELLGSGAGSAAADVLLLAGMNSSSVEPSITAKAIKRRKAAGAVSPVQEERACSKQERMC
jgi:hypothetical protein